MLNSISLEQRIGPKPYEYFEYKVLAKKPNNLFKLTCLFNDPTDYLINGPNRVEEIISITKKCFKNLAYFLEIAYFFV
jgi:hypothetical protein